MVSRRRLKPRETFGTHKKVEDCWKCYSNWDKNRQKLADCVVGFGKNAAGGKDGKIYVVTDSNDNDVINPKNGTLRQAVIQEEPLWIIFEHNMMIKLKVELNMNSYKTIDGRGANVHIAGDAGCGSVQKQNTFTSKKQETKHLCF